MSLRVALSAVAVSPIICAIDNLIKEIRNRDKYDSERKDSPLLKADDAIEVDTTNMTIEQQVDKMYKKIKLIEGKK